MRRSNIHHVIERHKFSPQSKYIYAKKLNAHLNTGSTTSYLKISTPSLRAPLSQAILIVDRGFGNSNDRLHYAKFIT